MNEEQIYNALKDRLGDSMKISLEDFKKAYNEDIEYRKDMDEIVGNNMEIQNNPEKKNNQLSGDQSQELESQSNLESGSSLSESEEEDQTSTFDSEGYDQLERDKEAADKTLSDLIAQNNGYEPTIQEMVSMPKEWHTAYKEAKYTSQNAERKLASLRKAKADNVAENAAIAADRLPQYKAFKEEIDGALALDGTSFIDYINRGVGKLYKLATGIPMDIPVNEAEVSEYLVDKRKESAREYVKADYENMVSEQDKMVESYDRAYSESVRILGAQQHKLSTGEITKEEYDSRAEVIVADLESKRDAIIKNEKAVREWGKAASTLVVMSTYENQSEMETFFKAGYNEFTKLPRQAAGLMNMGVAALSSVATGGSAEYALNSFKPVYDWLASITDENQLTLDTDNRMSALTGQVVAQLVEIVGTGGIAGAGGAMAFTSGMVYDEMYDEILKNNPDVSLSDANALATIYTALAAPMEYIGARMGMEAFIERGVKQNILKRFIVNGKLTKDATTRNILDSILAGGKQFVRASGMEAIEEGATEGSQFMVNDAIKEMYNKYIGESKLHVLKGKEYVDELLYNIGAGAYGGALGGGLGALRTLSHTSFNSVANTLLDDNSYQSLQALAKIKLDEGEISESTYNRTMLNMSDSRYAIGATKNIVNNNDRRQIITSLYEKANILRMNDNDIDKKAMLKSINAKIDEQTGRAVLSTSPAFKESVDYMKKNSKQFKRFTDEAGSGRPAVLVREDNEGNREVVPDEEMTSLRKSALRSVNRQISNITKQESLEGRDRLTSLHEIKENLENANGSMFYSAEKPVRNSMTGKFLNNQEAREYKAVESVASYLMRVEKERDTLSKEDVDVIKERLSEADIDPNSIIGMSSLENRKISDVVSDIAGSLRDIGLLSEANKSYLRTTNIARNTGVEVKTIKHLESIADKAGYTEKQKKSFVGLAVRLINSIASLSGKSHQEIVDSMKLGTKDSILKTSRGVGRVKPIKQLIEMYSELLPDSKKQAIAESLGHSKWSKTVQNKFGLAFMRYLSTGNAESTELKDTMKGMKSFIKSLYGGIKNTKIDVEVSESMKNLYESVLGEFDRAKKKKARLAQKKLNDNIVSIEDIKEKLAAKVKDARENSGVTHRLAYEFRKRFKLSEEEALTAAVLANRAFGTMARSHNITVEEYLDLYIEFRSGDRKTYKELKDSTKALFQIGGENSILSPQELISLENAKKMHSELSSRAKRITKKGRLANKLAIKQATGWELSDVDGKWRYEFDDNYKVKIDFLKDMSKVGKEFTLEEFLDHPTLFKKYPELKKYKLLIDPTLPSKSAYFNPNTKTIGIGHSQAIIAEYQKQKALREKMDKDPELYKLLIEYYKATPLERRERLIEPRFKVPFIKNGYLRMDGSRTEKLYDAMIELEYYWDEKNATDLSTYELILDDILEKTTPTEYIRETIVHEIQHAIQRIEGFPVGGNTEMVTDFLSNKDIKTYYKLLNYELEVLSKPAEERTDIDNDMLGAPREFLLEKYNSIAGEVEANIASDRQDLSEEERKKYLFTTPKDGLILVYPKGDSRNPKAYNSRGERNTYKKDALFQGAAGAMVREDSKFIIYALTDPNISTPLHEIAHVFESYLTKEERDTVLRAAGKKRWTRSTSEFFAENFEQFLADGKTKHKSLQGVIEQFANFIRNILVSVSPNKLNNDMRAIYDRMLEGDMIEKPKQEASRAKLYGYGKVFKKRGSKTPIENRIAYIKEKTIQDRNNELALELAEVDLALLFPEFGNKAGNDILKVLNHYMDTGDPSLLGAVKSKVEKSETTEEESDETPKIKGSVGSMDKYLAYDRMYKGAFEQMEKNLIPRTWKDAFKLFKEDKKVTLAFPSKAATRVFMRTMGDTYGVLRSELNHLSTEDFLKVVESIGLGEYMRGAGKSAMDVEAAQAHRDEINRFIRKNKLMGDNKRAGEFMSRTTFLAALMSPSSKAMDNLGAWYDSVINDTFIHEKSVHKIPKTGIGHKFANIAILNKWNRNALPEFAGDRELWSIAGAQQIRKVLMDIKNSLNGRIEDNWSNIEAELRRRFPKEMELLTLTSDMHKVHGDEVLNYKKLIGDEDTKVSNLYNSKSIQRASRKDKGDLEETDYYKTLQQSTTSLEDREFGGLEKGSYYRTWEFVESQQRAYNMASKKMHVGAAIRKMGYAIDSNEFADVMGDNIGVAQFRDKVKFMVNASVYDKVVETREAKEVLRKITNWKNQVLYSVKQLPVQLSVGSYTFVMAPREFIRAVSGADSKSDIEGKSRLIAEYSSLPARNASYVIDSSNRSLLSDNAVDRTLRGMGEALLAQPDYAVGVLSWTVMYEKKRREELKGTGQEFDWYNESLNPSKTAIAYAEMNQPAAQAPNIKEAGSKFSTDNNGWWPVIRDLMFPFKFFQLSFASNFLTDVSMATHDYEARRRLLAYMTVPASYSLVGTIMAKGLYTLIKNLLGEPEDDDETQALIRVMAESELEKLEGKTLKRLGAQMAQEVSPFAYIPFDELKNPMIKHATGLPQYYLGSGLYQDYESGKEVMLDHDKIFDSYWEFSKSEEPLLDIYDGKKNWGYLVPWIVPFADAIEINGIIKDGYIEGDNGNTIHINEEEREVLRKVRNYNLLSVFITIAEGRRFASKMTKYATDYASDDKLFDDLASRGLFNEESTENLYKYFEYNETGESVTVQDFVSQVVDKLNKAGMSFSVEDATPTTQEINQSYAEFKKLQKKIGKLNPSEKIRIEKLYEKFGYVARMLAEHGTGITPEVEEPEEAAQESN